MHDRILYEVQKFMEGMMRDNDKPEDFQIAQRSIMSGMQDLASHVTSKSLSSIQKTRELLDGIIPYGIRGQSGETIITPANVNKAMMSVRVERSLLSAGYTPEEIGMENDD